MYTTIVASEEQIEKLISKHLKVGGLSSIVNSSYSYDDEDDIGFMTLHTITLKTIEYQVRGDRPMFVSFTGFGSIRYDIHYPEGELFDILKKYAIKAKKKFWTGGDI